MKVLITGHLGFIGPHVVDFCKKEGYQVIGLDIGYFKECKGKKKNNLYLPDQEIIKDIRDINKNDIKDIDIIVHLAAISTNPLGEISPKITYEINYLATVKLAKLAKKLKVKKFIFFSSASIYGLPKKNNLNKPLDENAKLKPLTIYSKSKVKAEMALRKLRSKSFNIVFLRNASVYGVSNRTRFDVVLNNLVASNYVNNEITIKTNGLVWRPLVHVEDVACAVLAIIKEKNYKLCNQEYNVGKNIDNFQVLQLAKIIKKKNPKSKINILGNDYFDPTSYKINCSKILVLLKSFKPKWNVKLGINQISNELKKGLLKGRNFESRYFNRLKQMEYLINNKKINNQYRFKIK